MSDYGYFDYDEYGDDDMGDAYDRYHSVYQDPYYGGDEHDEGSDENDGMCRL